MKKVVSTYSSKTLVPTYEVSRVDKGRTEEGSEEGSKGVEGGKPSGGG